MRLKRACGIPVLVLLAVHIALFEELDRQGVLQAQFFVEDASFLARSPVAADPEMRTRFEIALSDTEALAQRVLAAEPRNHDALAYLRTHDNAQARELVAGLARDFPTNGLFARELQRMEASVVERGASERTVDRSGHRPGN